jgi:putative membrane protein
MNLKHKFTDDDLQRIKSAVKNAENKVSGEIVPVIVERSGHYSIAHYRSGIFLAAITFLIMIVIDRYVIHDASNSLYYDPFFIFIMVILGGTLGALLPTFFPDLKRFLTTQQHLDYVTHSRAENAFLEEEVFNTRQRTGIMIFVSFFEHEVIIMADQGISKVVPQNEWDKIVKNLIESIRNKKIVDGIEQAIHHCGDLLLDKGFIKTADDENELGDDLRIN